MWIIAKIKNSSSKIFERDLEKKINDKVDFYQPKLSIESKIKGKLVFQCKPLLENYIFCKHEKFKEKNSLSKYFFTRGLKYFLDGSTIAQKEIINFISNCKTFEDENGFIKNIFFKSIIRDKGKFLNGPLKNLVFKIVEKRNNKIKISLGNYFVTVDENSNNFYRPV